MPRRNRRSGRRKHRINDHTIGLTMFREATRSRVGHDAKYICHYCGTMTRRKSAQSDLRGFTVDHLVPLSRGGDWSLSNLVCACRECNNRKADMTEAEYRVSRARAG